MKRTVVVLILILFATLIGCANEPYTGGVADISIIIISDTTTYEENEDCKLLFIFNNIGERGIAYFSVLPIYGGPLYFKFSGNHSEEIKYVAPKGFTGISGGQGCYISPKSYIYEEIEITKYYSLEEYDHSGIITIEAEYVIESQDWERERLGYIGSNKIRIFFNMESELVNSSLIVEPHKWNTAWEKEQSDAGVFTVFLGNIDGYSVKDIKQDTVLFNGTLKPVDIKITGSHKDMKGKVMMLKFKKKNGMEYLGIKEPGDIKKINISGQLNDDKWFHAEAEVEIEGAKEKGSQ